MSQVEVTRTFFAKKEVSDQEGGETEEEIDTQMPILQVKPRGIVEPGVVARGFFKAVDQKNGQKGKNLAWSRCGK